MAKLRAIKRWPLWALGTALTLVLLVATGAGLATRMVAAQSTNGERLAGVGDVINLSLTAERLDPCTSEVPVGANFYEVPEDKVLLITDIVTVGGGKTIRVLTDVRTEPIFRLPSNASVKLDTPLVIHSGEKLCVGHGPDDSGANYSLSFSGTLLDERRGR